MDKAELKYKIIKSIFVTAFIIISAVTGYIISDAYSDGDITPKSSMEQRSKSSENGYSISADKSELDEISLKAELFPDENAPKKYKVDLNTADVNQLMTLPEIGESRAKSIVRLRYEMGGFRCVEDLRNTEGIGKTVYNKIKNRVYVSRISDNVRQRIFKDKQLVDKLEYEERLKNVEK